MKPGELYKPYQQDCVLLYVGNGVFGIEAGTPVAFLRSPLDGKIHFDPESIPPMHRAWHWSDLATPAQAEAYPDPKGLQAEVLFDETTRGGKKILVLNKTLYFYTVKL